MRWHGGEYAVISPDNEHFHFYQAKCSLASGTPHPPLTRHLPLKGKALSRHPPTFREEPIFFIIVMYYPDYLTGMEKGEGISGGVLRGD